MTGTERKASLYWDAREMLRRGRRPGPGRDKAHRQYARKQRAGVDAGDLGRRPGPDHPGSGFAGAGGGSRLPLSPRWNESDLGGRVPAGYGPQHTAAALLPPPPPPPAVAAAGWGPPPGRGGGSPPAGGGEGAQLSPSQRIEDVVDHVRSLNLALCELLSSEAASGRRRPAGVGGGDDLGEPRHGIRADGRAAGGEPGEVARLPPLQRTLDLAVRPPLAFLSPVTFEPSPPQPVGGGGHGGGGGLAAAAPRPFSLSNSRTPQTSASSAVAAASARSRDGLGDGALYSHTY